MDDTEEVRAYPHRSGFTLAECMLAMAVLAAMAFALSSAITAAQGQSSQLAHSQQATMLAEELMERILALPYYDPHGSVIPGPDAGETGPANFDNADDYHGFTESAGQLRDRAGSLYPREFQVFSRSVSAQYGTTSLGVLGSIPCLNVTVTVQNQQGRGWTLTRMIPQPAT